MTEGLVLIVFAGWFVLSCLGQLPRFHALIAPKDKLFLVPRWSFFAPIPAKGDFHLLYRDRLRDGSITDWTELPIGGKRSLFNAIWNPSRRQRKALFDISSELALQVRTLSATEVQGTIPYLLLLNHISRMSRSGFSEASQFLLVYSYGSLSTKEPDAMYLSSFHDL